MSRASTGRRSPASRFRQLRGKRQIQGWSAPGFLALQTHNAQAFQSGTGSAAPTRYSNNSEAPFIQPLGDSSGQGSRVGIFNLSNSVIAPSLATLPVLRKPANWAATTRSQRAPLSGFCASCHRRPAVWRNRSGPETPNARTEWLLPSSTAPARESCPVIRVRLPSR